MKRAKMFIKQPYLQLFLPFDHQSIEEKRQLF